MNSDEIRSGLIEAFGRFDVAEGSDEGLGAAIDDLVADSPEMLAIPSERWDEICHSCEAPVGDHTVRGQHPAEAIADILKALVRDGGLCRCFDDPESLVLGVYAGVAHDASTCACACHEKVPVGGVARKLVELSQEMGLSRAVRKYMVQGFRDMHLVVIADQPDHILTVDHLGMWFIEHSVACRVAGTIGTCKYNDAVMRVAEDLVSFVGVGRWRITEVDEGLPSLERAE